MEKEKGNIKFIETDDGYRIEVTGKDLKDMIGCCCMPMVGGGKTVKVECRATEEEKK
jgi:hypothetical protein